MRVVRVSKGGKETDVKVHGLRDDDTVGTAAAKLAAISGKSSVYMWVHRPVTPHEAFGIMHADPDVPAAEAAAKALRLAPKQTPRPAKGAGSERSEGVPLRVPANVAASKKALMEFLTSMRGRLTEAVSLRGRHAVPGGYYLSRGVDPWLGGGPKPSDGSDDEAQMINFSNLVLENFGLSDGEPGEGRESASGVLYYTTREDLLSARSGQSAELWESRVLNRYTYPPDAEASGSPDQTVVQWSPPLDRLLDRHARALSDAAQRKAAVAVVTFAKVTGGVPSGCPLASPVQWAQQFLEHFAAAPTSAQVPMMQLGHGAVVRKISKVHESIPDDVRAGLASRIRPPSSGEYLQFALRSGEDIAVLTLNTMGKFSLQVSYRAVDARTPEDFLESFAGVATGVLSSVSEFYPPVDPSCLRATSTSYQKVYVTNTPRCVLEVAAEVSAPEAPARVAKMKPADRGRAAALHLANYLASATGPDNAGWPVLRGVNVREGKTAHMQYLRSPNITLKSVVQGIARFADARGINAVISGIAKDFDASVGDVAAIVEAKADALSTMPSVSVTRVSDTRVRIVAKFVCDYRYIRRMLSAVAVACKGSSDSVAVGAALKIREEDRSEKSYTKGLTFKGVSQRSLKSAVADDMDLDEFMDILDDSGPGSDGVLRVDGAAQLAPGSDAEASGEDGPAPADGRGPDGRGPDGRGPDGRGPDGRGPDGQRDDVLRRLKRMDPDVFAQPPAAHYAPYSVKCQKGKQPVALTESDVKKARADPRSKEALDRAVRFGSSENKVFSYVCPEKWCLSSGVARKKNETCPEPGEPSWTFADDFRFPGFLPGVQHPKGLCMPCCYRKPVKEGSVMAQRARDCEASAGRTGDGKATGTAPGAAGDAPDAPDAPDAGNEKAGNAHVNRADRILEKGVFGEVPSELGEYAYKSAPRRKDNRNTRLVRIGMGLDNDLPDALAYLADRLRPLAISGGAAQLKIDSKTEREVTGPVRRLCADVADGMKPSHFMQTWAPRQFAFVGDAPPSQGEVDAFASKAGGFRDLVRSTKGDQQSARDRILARSFAEYVKQLRLAAEGSKRHLAAVSNTLLSAVNSGALAWMPPVHLLSLNTGGSAFAEHAGSRGLAPGADACVVLTRNGVIEPLGLLSGRGRVRVKIPGDAPWLKSIKAGIAAALPEEQPDAVRMVGYCMLAVGTLSGGRFLPFSTPVLVDGGVKHAFVDGISVDSPLAGAIPAGHRAAEAAGKRTGVTEFYPPSDAWKTVAERTLADDRKDGAIFTGVLESRNQDGDRREKSLAWIKTRQLKSDQIASAVLKAIQDAGGDPLLNRRLPTGSSSGDSISDRKIVEGITNRYWKDIRAAASGATRDEALNAVYNIVRPAPQSAMPDVVLAPGDRLVTS
jgi:hypothetical protein